MVRDTEIIINLDMSNFGRLQSATSGYYLLTAPIDFDKLDLNGDEEGLGAWTPTGDSKGKEFTGVFNGNDLNITNFTSPAGNLGLFAWVKNATIKRLNIHIKSNTSNGGLIGQIKENASCETIIEKVNVVVDSLASGNHNSAICSVIQGGLKFVDTNVLVKTAAAGGNYNGVVYGAASSTCAPVYDSVIAVSLDGKLNANVLAYPDWLPKGTDGEAANPNDDYYLYSSEDDLKTAYGAGTLPQGFVDFLVECGVLAKSAE